MPNSNPDKPSLPSPAGALLFARHHRPGQAGAGAAAGSGRRRPLRPPPAVNSHGVPLVPFAQRPR